MKPRRLSCTLRRCANPSCGIAFHPTRCHQTLCRVCRPTKVERARGVRHARRQTQ